MLTDHAAAYRRNAERLAEWAWERMVNRTDRYVYYSEERMRTTKSARLDLGRVLQHFRASKRSDLISLPSNSECGRRHSTAKWSCFDVDCHGGDDPAKSSVTAHSIKEAIEMMGMNPLMLSSNGAGGFHIYILYNRPIAVHFAWGVCRIVLNQAQTACEFAPHNGRCDIDNIQSKPMRLFGKHHTRDHYAEVVEHDKILSGGHAIQAILQHQPTNVEAIPTEAFEAGNLEVAPRKRPTYEPRFSNTVSQTTIDYCRGLAPNGDSNRMLFGAACDLKARGLSYEEAVGILEPASTARGKSASELHATVRSAYKKNRVPGRSAFSTIQQVAEAKRIRSGSNG